MPAAERRAVRGDELNELANGFEPIDFDPEDEIPNFDDSGSEPAEDGANGFDGREHYEKVGKSRLRGRDPARLGPQYAGSRVNRKAIEKEEEEHNPFGEYGSDEGSDVNNGLEDSSAEENDDEDMEDNRSALEEEDDEDATFDMDVIQNRAQAENEKNDLQRILAAQNKSVATSLATSQRVDAQKGAAVKRQRRAFDSLLNSRIRLQNGLVALNTLPTVPDQEQTSSVVEAALSAETAARKLWTTLDGLRCTLADAKTGSKRKRPLSSASLPQLWNHMASLDTSMYPHRRSTLTKWSDKTQSGAIKAARSSTSKLNSTPRVETSLLDMLDAQLADSDRLVKKTKIPRSGAPVQAKEYTAARRARQHDHDLDSSTFDPAEGVPEIFDDADFYSHLLKELLDQRAADRVSTITNGTGTAAPDLESEYRAASSKSAATKKLVDTRASKGRKMRYTVHEKLLNFMVPEDRGSWGEGQAGELFGSLFGASKAFNGRGKENAKVNEADGDDVEGALRLFRG